MQCAQKAGFGTSTAVKAMGQTPTQHAPFIVQASLGKQFLLEAALALRTPSLRGETDTREAPYLI